MENNLNDQDWMRVAEVELVYRTTVKPSQRPRIKSTKDAAELLLKTWDFEKIELVEQFKILLLNRANRVLGIVDISTGGITCTVADPKIIFSAALKANAVSIILSHNHPSGSLKPSSADEALTAKVAQAGKFLDIKVVDHVIVTSEGFFSFAEEGLL